MRGAEKLELALIPIVSTGAWLMGDHLPDRFTSGRLLLMLSALLLLQSLVRDLWLLRSAASSETPRTMVCLCAESGIGMLGILIGAALMLSGWQFNLEMTSGHWAVLMAATLGLGFAIKDPGVGTVLPCVSAGIRTTSILSSPGAAALKIAGSPMLNHIDKTDRWLDAALVVCGGCLGLTVGFFAMVIAGAQFGLSLGWITGLASLGGLTGGLSTWFLYTGVLKHQSRFTRMTVLVLFVSLLALVLPMPFQYTLVRG